MKRIALFLSLILLLGASSLRGENRQYEDPLKPGELYFVQVKHVTGGSYVYTNELTYMWYLDKAVVLSPNTNCTSTNAAYLVVKHTDVLETPYTVVTNDFGNIETNYQHSITGSTDTYMTNLITSASWSNSCSARSEITPEDDYIQRGDILRFTFSNTNIFLKLTGRR